MEPVLVIPSYGFHRVANPCGLGRRCYWSPRNSSPLTSASRLLQLLDDDDFCDGDTTWPSLVLSFRSRDTNRSDDESETKADDNNKTKADDKQKDSSEKEQTSDKFSVSLQLGDAFSPEELSVKLVDRSLRIEGKHEERGEDGDFSSRQFSRSFLLPDDVDLDQLTSSFTAEGVLSIEAPRLAKKELEPPVRNIPIQQGEAAASINDENTPTEEHENTPTEEHENTPTEEHENTPTEEQNEKAEDGEAQNDAAEDVEEE